MINGEENKMSEERIREIEKLANDAGLSFASAKMMLEEIEADDFDCCDAMREVWY
jgi:hypothetical protein